MCDVANINTPVVYDALELDNVESYTKRPYLVFRAIKENLHGRCAINSFQFSRSVDSTRLGGFQWTMSLRVYDGADTKDPTRMEFLKHIDGVTQSINQISGLVEAVLSGVQGYVGQVTNSVGDVFRSVGALANTLGTFDNTIYGIAESVMGTADDYMNMLGALGSLVDSDEWASDLEGYEGTVSAYEARWKTGSSIQEEALAAASEPDLETATLMLVSDTSEMLYQANILLGYLGLAGRGGVSSPSQRRGFLERKDGFEILSALYTQETVMSRTKDNGDQYRYEYIMRAGESLLTLANRFMGSPAEWATLAEINNCLDAHTFGDGSPILAGSIILIPISTEGVTMPLNPREVTTAEDAMHTDFYLLDGDLELESNLGDLNLVGGLLNIKQAIINRIRSTVEEVTISPEYGVDFPLIGSKITSGDATLIAVKLRESLLDDARVLDVQDMTITPLGDTLTVQLTVLSIGRTSATFRVEI
jgi:hypothetical protein